MEVATFFKFFVVSGEYFSFFFLIRGVVLWLGFGSAYSVFFVDRVKGEGGRVKYFFLGLFVGRIF